MILHVMERFLTIMCISYGPDCSKQSFRRLGSRRHSIDKAEPENSLFIISYFQSVRVWIRTMFFSKGPNPSLFKVSNRTVGGREAIVASQVVILRSR